MVCPLSTTKPGNGYGIKKWSGATTKRPDPDIRCLQICFGIPLLLLLHTIPSIPAIYALEALYNAMMTGNTDGALRVGLVMLSLATVAFIYSFIESETTFWCVVFLKRIVIGTFKAGPRPNTLWDEFRRWLLERIVSQRSFKMSMENWVGSEILSMKYRLLGSKIGKKGKFRGTLHEVCSIYLCLNRLICISLFFSIKCILIFFGPLSSIR